MSDDLPFVSCICCTYRHPTLLANALSCFLAQDYPADRRELVILEDAGQFPAQRGANWRLISVGDNRFRSLSEKHNAVAALARKDSEVYCVWDDDDAYLPWHISAHVEAMTRFGRETGGPIWGFSKPSTIWSTYGGELHQELSSGRFQGSIAFGCKLFEFAGGWDLTKRADFDQKFLFKMAANNRASLCKAFQSPSDPCSIAAPSYVYRWESTNAPHCSAIMKSPVDEAWYDEYAKQDFKTTWVDITMSTRNGFMLSPRFDEETIKLYSQINKSNLVGAVR